VEKTLAPGETILYRAHFHWLYKLWAIIALLVLGVVLVGVYIFLYIIIRIWVTEIVVTSDRLVFKTGFIARRTQEMSLDKIEEIKVMQSVFGRIFGFGSLDVRGTGEGNIQIPVIANPLGMRRAIQKARAQYRGDTESVREHSWRDVTLTTAGRLRGGPSCR
jgi:uncharacterized membrane protein YdbT with pleckstrin-like domain